MGAYNVYAYARGGDDHKPDLRREGIAEWQLPKAIRWAVNRGCDTILIEITDAAAPARALPVHHVCTDPACPGGC